MRGARNHRYSAPSGSNVTVLMMILFLAIIRILDDGFDSVYEAKGYLDFIGY